MYRILVKTLSVLLFVMTAFAGLSAMAAEKEAPKKIEEVSEAFAKDFPYAKVQSVDESGLPGIYEIVSGNNIIYYHPETGRMIFGEMLEKTGKNITAEKREALLATKLETLPLDKAIKIGSGKTKVIEIVDVDCPYCRKLEEFFKSREDVTRYVFLLPLESIHPKSMAKTKEVLCAKNKASMFIDAMAGKLDNAELKGCDNQKVDKTLGEFKSAAAALGVTGTPVLWVNNKQIVGADLRKLEALLGGDKAQVKSN
jgi:thiol:disulfide interchange protein DsbC